MILNIIFSTFRGLCRGFKPAVLVLSGILIAGPSKAQQYGEYTQYMSNLTPLNSAASLLNRVGSVNSLYRAQYVGIQGAPNTFIFNGNIPLNNIASSTGLIIDNDNFAIEHQTVINAYFAKAVQLNSGDFLAVSINGGLQNYLADYASLATTDPQFANNVRETKGTVGFGILYYTNNYYLGLSVPQLTFRSLGVGSAIDDAYFKNHYYFSGAYLFNNEDSGIGFKPAALVAYVSGAQTVADISGTIYFRHILGIGVDYRTTSEMAGIISYNINNIRIGYSYQFNSSSSNLDGFSNAVHEITLSYFFGKDDSANKDL